MRRTLAVLSAVIVTVLGVQAAHVSVDQLLHTLDETHAPADLAMAGAFDHDHGDGHADDAAGGGHHHDAPASAFLAPALTTSTVLAAIEARPWPIAQLLALGRDTSLLDRPPKPAPDTLA